MKKITIFLFVVVFVLLAIIGIKYSLHRVHLNEIKNENAKYEKYLNQEIYGIDLATLINKSVDQNVTNNVESDDKGIFVPNQENSIHIEIFMKDNETTYKMEIIHNSGTEQFVRYYGDVKFKCLKTEYHKKTGKIKYMLFEQL